MDSKQIILNRVRGALRDVPKISPEEDVALDWTYGQPVAVGDVLDDFVQKCVDYKADVERVPAAEVPATITRLLAEHGVRTVIVPAGVPAEWRSAVIASGAEALADDPPKTNAELNQIEGVVTAARVGIADTGTIVLDHDTDQGRRALSLVPDTHVCVIRADQVVSGVPEATQVLKSSVAKRLPLTWISGPSATSDIELSRVEGVHGPRNLLIILVDD
jgi:L-lactate dehydrogenase complex protein LldG